MASFSRTAKKLESGTRVGWLYQYHPTTVLPTGNVVGADNDGAAGGGGGASSATAKQQGRDDPEEKSSGRSAMHLFFFTQEGEIFDVNLVHAPYFFVVPAEGHEREVELGLTGAFGDDILSVQQVEKEDLGMANHLSGKRRLLLKLTFDTTGQLTAVRQGIEKATSRYAKKDGAGVAAGDAMPLDFSSGFVDLEKNPALSFLDEAKRREQADTRAAAAASAAATDRFSWAEHVLDIREYDVKYYVRVAIDLDVFVGVWYNVTVEAGEARVSRVKEDLAPLMPRVCAFDIETTKAPLRFPQPETDQIYMLSYMLDGKGYLIVNRDIVSAPKSRRGGGDDDQQQQDGADMGGDEDDPNHIEDFSYTPKPEYEGFFEVKIVENEKELLEAWFDHMDEYRPMVYVTYNGDYFDFPFIAARSEVYRLSMRKRIGFAQNEAAEGATLNPSVPHIDCFTADTPITLADGRALPISSVHAGHRVLTYSSKDNGFVSARVNRNIPRPREREVLQLTFADGRTVRCTPEHRFQMADGSWCAAKDIPLGLPFDAEHEDERHAARRDSECVLMGVAGTPCEATFTAAEEAWSFECASTKEHPGERDEHLNVFPALRMSTDAQRQRTLAFCRLLGAIRADGHVAPTGDVTVTLGDSISVEDIKRDVALVGATVTVHERSNSVWWCDIRGAAAQAIAALPGMVAGDRCHQAPRWPAFLLQKKCPVACVREFLAAFFGGNGCAPHVVNTAASSLFSSITCAQTACDGREDELVASMQTLCDLLERCGCSTFQVRTPVPIVGPYQQCSCERHYKVYIEAAANADETSSSFMDKIGIRYSTHKRCRFEVAAAWSRYVAAVNRQHTTAALAAGAEKQIRDTEGIISEAAVCTRGPHKRSNVLKMARGWRDDRAETDPYPGYGVPRFTRCLDAAKFFRAIGAEHMFNKPVSGSGLPGVLTEAVGQKISALPAFRLHLIHRRSAGVARVYDISVEHDDHNFLANGLVAHNCFYWVKRDSYLPNGSHGLKAVTKAKLGYDPVEVDPEDMLPLAQSDPKKMAAYSVSDALATYYLYMKYVHPFIFSLCTIIPMAPDDVLRKGSGTLCESLLCVQAYAKNVLFPNKVVQPREKFHNGHLIDRETYIGGRVEALQSGVYRSNIPMKFSVNPATLQMLSDKLDDALHFAIEEENGCKMADVTNFAEVRDAIRAKLHALRDQPELVDTPLIYHLDVAAMYPNIILTNRLQPPAMVTPEVCASCIFNTPDNEHGCKRPMHWMWRGSVYTANRHEYARVKAQLEQEAFLDKNVADAEAATAQRKAYGNKRGNVLEGTEFEKRRQERNAAWREKRAAEEAAKTGAGAGYRKGAGGGGGGGAAAAASGGGGGGRRGFGAGRGDNDDDDAGGGSDDDGDNPKKRRGGGGGGSDDDDADDDDGVLPNGARRFHHLNPNEQNALLRKRLMDYCRKAYRKTKVDELALKESTVCMRENSFYIDTVRLFRDRRYEYKAGLKKWKAFLDDALKGDDEIKIKEGKTRCVQMESLQLAHKCILNSFYGYVMRKGSRWYSMEMGGIVTYCGATLIQLARALVQEIGVTLELDTDGIWCCLPACFPENFVVKTSNPKKPKFEVSYPCLMLNKDVADRFTNHQYQTLHQEKRVAPDGTETVHTSYTTHSECSIGFEVDGPYLSMILPASQTEGKLIKKRYAVFHPDGRLAELKGFELKRRGELMLVKDFQALVFRQFLCGTTLVDAYGSAAQIANDALDLLYGRGAGYDEEEVLARLTESCSLSKRLADYPAGRKGLGLTTARRIAEFLGPQMVKDKGLTASFVISRLPHGRPVSERPIPLVLFRAPIATRMEYLRKWTGDSNLVPTSSLADVIDWDYYIGRFASCVQKIITIPAALQFVPNPVPRVKHPDWLIRFVASHNTRLRQPKITSFLIKKAPTAAASAGAASSTLTLTGAAAKALQGVELEEVFDLSDIGKGTRVTTQKQKSARGGGSGSDDDDDDAGAGKKRKRDGDEDNMKNHDSSDDEVGSDADSISSLRRIERSAAKKTVRDEAAAKKRRIDGFLRAHFPARSQAKMSAQALLPSTPGFGEWLSSARDKWAARAKTREQLGGGGKGMEAKSKAMYSSWTILEVRPEPAAPSSGALSASAPQPASYVRVFALLNNALHSMRCAVDRAVLVDLASPAAAQQLLERFPALQGRVSAVQGKVLPRHHMATFLVDINLSRLPAATCSALMHWLRSESEACIAVYEDHLTETELAILKLGVSAEVNVPAHIARIKERKRLLASMAAASSASSGRNKGVAKQRGGRVALLAAATAGAALGGSGGGAASEAASLHDFYLSELDSLDHRQRSRYLLDSASGALKPAFIFHVGSDATATAGTRGMLAVFFWATRTARVVVVQSAAAQRPPLHWPELIAAVIKNNAALEVPAGFAAGFRVAVDYTSDWGEAYGMAEAALRGAFDAKTANTVVLQTAWKPGAFFARVRVCNEMPVMRVAGALDDQAVILSDAMQWVKGLCKRALARFFSGIAHISERSDVSRVGGVPLCNVGFDAYMSAWDTLFMRALQRHGHVLWDPAAPRAGGGGGAGVAAASSIADEEPEVRRTEAAAPGGYLSWSVELGFSNIDVLSVIFSQHIQEADDHVAAQMLETSGRLGSHFSLLRDVVSTLYSSAARQNEAAAAALQNFPRWLRCTASMCYDPKLVTYVNTLVSRALAAFLLRVTQLGGRIVYASKARVIISTPKHDIDQASDFAKYLIDKLREAALIRHMNPHVRRLWSALAVQDVLNYVGSYVLPPGAPELEDDEDDAEAHDDAVHADADRQERQPDDLGQDLVSSAAAAAAAAPSASSGKKKAAPTRYQLRLDMHLPAVAALGNSNVVALAMHRMTEMMEHVELAKQKATQQLAADPTVTLATAYERMSSGIKRALTGSLSETMQPQLLSDVNEVLVDNSLRHTVGGGATSAVKTLAATFASVVCTMMQRVDEDSPVPRRTLNNCLRLCTFSPFSPDFAAGLWFAGTDSHRVTIMRFACPFCNTECVLDLTQPKQFASLDTSQFMQKLQQQIQQRHQQAQQQDRWSCSSCETVLSTAAIEASCVRSVHRLLARLHEQDFVCMRCQQSSASLLAKQCTCGGNLAPRLSRAEVLTRIARFHTVAQMHNLPWLADTVNESFSDLVAPAA